MIRPDVPRHPLHDAADALRAATDPLGTVYANIADWLQDTARRADNPLSTISRAELDHAHRIAQATVAVCPAHAAAPDVHHCLMCGERCRWEDAPTGGWWAHEVHPEDGHDAVAGSPCRPGDDYCEGDAAPHRHAPLTDDPSGAHITPAGRAAVLDYKAIRREQHPRPRLEGGPS